MLMLILINNGEMGEIMENSKINYISKMFNFVLMNSKFYGYIKAIFKFSWTNENIFLMITYMDVQ